jgi:hypothetical protein
VRREQGLQMEPPDRRKPHRTCKTCTASNRLAEIAVQKSEMYITAARARLRDPSLAQSVQYALDLFWVIVSVRFTRAILRSCQQGSTPRVAGDIPKEIPKVNPISQDKFILWLLCC